FPFNLAEFPNSYSNLKGLLNAHLILQYSVGKDMEDTQAIPCSSLRSEDSSAIGDRDGDTSLPTEIIWTCRMVGNLQGVVRWLFPYGGGLENRDDEISMFSMRYHANHKKPALIAARENFLSCLAVSHADGSLEEAWFDDDFNDDLELHNEWKLRRDKFYTDGYREGIIEGQKDSAQEGFNLGFKDSLRVGCKWGIVRGVTSALSHIPDELKKKLVAEEEVRREFLNVHDQVDAIATEDALKFYYDKIKREKSEEQSNSVDSDQFVTHQSDCVVLETYVRKLELLLKESRLINVGLESNESCVINVGLELSNNAGVDVLMSPH
ncbi:hypothetical protein KSS87_013034, partial [Heliosperma pusillum]